MIIEALNDKFLHLVTERGKHGQYVKLFSDYLLPEHHNRRIDFNIHIHTEMF